jgi:multisubunit Na+/H+ antiporter MnhC subunit
MSIVHTDAGLVDLETIMRDPWPEPTKLAIEPCGCGLAIHASVCDQGRNCPLNEPTTEPGELANLREVRPPVAHGIVLTAIGVLLAVALVATLAALIR